ncbi:hypothetical protein ACFQZC_21605 [Streptacidiphilus monticola]
MTTHSMLSEPTPARIGTAARKTGSRPSEMPYCFWMPGMRVTSRANRAPCAT